jgi:hypothetical protein
MPANPNRRHVPPAPGARYLSSVVVANLRTARRLRDQSQDGVALRMRQLGHENWSRATVSELEREGRSLSLDEVFSLAIVLERPLADLFDPTGLEGRNNEPIDYGGGATLPAKIVRAWTRGQVQLSFPGPGSFTAYPMPGHENVLAEVQKAMDEHDKNLIMERVRLAEEQGAPKRGTGQ